ncbi:MAG: ABC transporter ATP-binding protein [Candidatus Heimdallarchaeaceae archaeon]
MKNENQYAIETKDLVKIYKTGKVLAVDELNLKIKKGEIYALIGANGSGKTTTLNMISGALFPTSGSITVLGYEIPKYRRFITNYIGLAPQDYSIYHDLSLEENVRFFARLYGMSKTDFRIRYDELLKILSLEDKRKSLVKNLSGGMKRRVSIACASHVMDEAERADRIGLMRAGKLIAEGYPEELKKEYNATSIEDIFIKLSEGEIVDE